MKNSIVPVKFFKVIKYIFLSVICVVILFDSCYCYYDLDFSTQDELDYLYETGQIDSAIYEDYSARFDYFEPKENDEQYIYPKKFSLKYVAALDDYKEKTSDISNYLTLKSFFTNFNFGVLGSEQNYLSRTFDDNSNVFVDNNISRKLDLKKYYAAYCKDKSSQIIVGNFKAKFGLGLTFSRANMDHEGIASDLDLPYKRTFYYLDESKKDFIDSNYLSGVGLYQHFDNFEFYGVYSRESNPANDIVVKNSAGDLRLKTVNGVEDEEIKSFYVIYTFLKFMRFGGIYYSLDSEYKYSLFDTKNFDGKGVYFDLNLNDFSYKNEFSFVGGKTAFINTFGYDSKKDFQFNFSYRDYPEDYNNPLSDSLSLHPNKKYFRCTDERGMRFNVNYKYDFMKFYKNRFDVYFQTDIFKYTRKKIYNSKSMEYDTVQLPSIVNKSCVLNSRYLLEKMIYEIDYRCYDRNVSEISAGYDERKDEYLDFKIAYDDKRFDSTVKYSTKFRGTDLPDESFSENLSFLMRIYVLENTFISTQINFADSNVNSRIDDKFSYVFKFGSNISNRFNFNLTWYSRDNILKKYFNETDTENFYYDADSLNKWRLEVEYML